MKKTALFAALLCLAQSSLHADVPLSVNYQGKVYDSAGLPIGATGTASSYVAAPTNRKIIFRIYSAATGGNPLWTEEQTVTISSGEFSVLLGQGIVATGLAAGGGTATLATEQAAHTDISTIFASGSSRFLELVVDEGVGTINTSDTPITPRQQITSTGYCFHAKVADSIASSTDLNFSPLTGTATNSGLGWYGTGRSFGGIAVDGPVLYGNAGGALGSNASGTQKLALVWNASGQVGVGTTSSYDTNNKLTLQGDDAVSPARQLVIRGNSDTTKRLNVGFDTTGNQATLQSYTAASTAGNLLLNPSGGNVGIGTTSPANRLTVAGGNVYVSGTNSGVQVANAGATKMVEMSIADSAGSFSTSAVAGDAVIRASATAKLHLQTGSGASAVSIDSSNNVTMSNSVGIGTSTPTNRFSLDAPVSARSTSTTVTTATALAHIGAADSSAYFGSYDSSAGWGNWIQSMRSWDNLPFPLMLNPNGGFVGIGTAAPAYKLDVNGTAHVASDVYLNNNSTLWAPNTAGTFQAVFWPRANDNGTYLNYGTNGFFIRNNAQVVKMYITDGGNVGIGTASPLAPLHVAGGVNNTFTLECYMDGNGVNNVSEDRNNLAHSIIADARIQSGSGFDVASDLRIKNIQKISEGGADLATLMKIQVTDYLYKDLIAKGKCLQKKVIAQQVETVYPQAVTQSTDVVPDLYKKAAVKDGWIELATDLKVGERVKLIGKKDQSVHEVLEVRDGAFRTDGKVETDHVFVYGREVKDFRTVDYDAIAMLNVSATQQVKREKDAEIQALRDENAALRRELAAKDESVEARLIALEQRLSKGSAAETVSINTANAAK